MTIIKSTFALTTEECELLVEFEKISNLNELAQKMGRDHSVLSRTLKKIGEKFPVVEKKAGKWVLTELGRKLNAHTRATAIQQSSILSTHSILRIGTNREFAARVMAPDFNIIQNLFPDVELSINSYENGTESYLLNGQIDIGIDCDRPYDPEVAYKLVAQEPLVIIAAKSFIKKNVKIINAGGHLSLPHLLCERLHPDKILLKSENQFKIIGRFNDIATTREVCIQGAGWALLPRYAVENEMKAGNLVQMTDQTFGNTSYGIRWLRRQNYLKNIVVKLTKWLEEKKF